MSLGLLFWQLGELHGQSSTAPSFRVIQPRKYKNKETYRSVYKGIYKMQTPDPMFAIFCGTPREDLNRNKDTIKAGGSTAICKMSTGWVMEWMGDTPLDCYDY